MSIPLAQKIDQIKVRYQGETSVPPHEILAICEALNSRIDNLLSQVSPTLEAMVRLDARLNAVERLAATYNPDARGR